MEGMIHQHSVKRVKKKINDFILNNYNTLFFAKPTDNMEESSAQTLNAEEILSNPKLI